jgi:hypothetical protein
MRSINIRSTGDFGYHFAAERKALMELETC